MSFESAAKEVLLKQFFSPSNTKRRPRYVLVIHGGAGTITRQGSSDEQQAAYKLALSQALLAGYKLLNEGADAIDAVVAAVSVMEDDPLFNSAKGAVFNIEGKIELDASIMVSKPPFSHPEIPSNRRGLGLTLLTRTKNPSHLVRSLYLAPSLAPHTLLSGATAERLGQSLGETLVDPSYFFTEHRWKEHRRGLGLPEEPVPQPGIPLVTAPQTPLDAYPTGTVGAVALDVHGCIASLTSTGGKTNKLVGRIGDTPQMGSGFWAEEWPETNIIRRLWRKFRGLSSLNRGVGVSGTGDGDYFIRRSAAVTISHRVRYLHESLEEATRHVVHDLLAEGGLGGFIALDLDGNVSMPLNCGGMYRGVIREDGIAKTAIFADEDVA
ncbi:Isoaspartyl peptidase [Psilocybe cubensis]|uniref:Isoaspartyl peptidase n=2 Tax=Psilocybe cubensis TaxID=181762 RepID=A0ACB8HBH9_PSICU|nr:Isoaspartyl peptidase [Psilocybe cubensis]KAH9485288.1 Isoaspartyl peptidase [Psilocybe cubensis]